MKLSSPQSLCPRCPLHRCRSDLMVGVGVGWGPEQVCSWRSFVSCKGQALGFEDQPRPYLQDVTLGPFLLLSHVHSLQGVRMEGKGGNRIRKELRTPKRHCGGSVGVPWSTVRSPHTPHHEQGRGLTALGALFHASSGVQGGRGGGWVHPEEIGRVSVICGPKYVRSN